MLVKAKMSIKMTDVSIPICRVRDLVNQGLLLHGRSDGSVGVGNGEAKGHPRSKQYSDVKQRSMANPTVPGVGEEGHNGGFVVMKRL